MESRREIEQPIWSVKPPTAQLTCSVLSGRIDVARPQTGLHNAFARGTRLDGYLLAVSRATDGQWPLRLAESYVRDRDLVATYEPATDWPYASQVYWRAESASLDVDEPAFVELSLLVSVQTHLLDTCPRITVETELLGDELVQIGRSCLVWRLPGGELSYAEMMLPSDYRELNLKTGTEGMHSASWELFAEFLEKGVIRKARLKAVLLPRENDVALANGCYEALSRQPLPLTT